MSINPQLFTAAGETLYGEEWKQPLADLLGMNVRTVRRIAKAAKDGEPYPVHPSLAATLAEHLRNHAKRARTQAAEAELLADVLLET